MEPQGSSAPSPSPEMGSQQTGQQSPESPQLANGAETSAGGETREVAAQAGPGGAMPVLPSLPQLPSPQAQAAAPTTPVVNDDNPMVAADDEVIEKEWVEKAKKIVAQTKDDPYSQEQQVSKLQADYIKKRYGKEIKVPGE